jgi:hypothetical protein
MKISLKTILISVTLVMPGIIPLTVGAQNSPPPIYGGRNPLPGPSNTPLVQGNVYYTPSGMKLWGNIGETPYQYWQWDQDPTTDIPWAYISDGGGFVSAGWMSIGGLGQGRLPWNLDDWTKTMVAIEPDVRIGLGIRANPFVDGPSVPFVITVGETYQFSIGNYGALQWTVKANESNYTSLATTVWDTTLDRLSPGVLGVNGNALVTQPTIKSMASQIAALQTQVATLQAQIVKMQKSMTASHSVATKHSD